MAYAGIAGVPPLYGVYAAVLPLVAYALIGTSPVLAVGPDSATALISFHVISRLVTSGNPTDFVTHTAALTLIVAAIFLAAGVLRSGWLANFISIPVMRGFIQGLVWVTIVSQLPKLLGLKVKANDLFSTIEAIVRQARDIDTITTAVGLGSVAALLAFKRWLPRAPRSLIIVALAIAIVSLLGLDRRGVAIVGQIPGGLPAISVPKIDWTEMSVLLPGAAAIALLGYAESLGAAQAVGRKAGGEVQPNQELLALGAANVGSALCGGFVAVGSLSKTIVAQQAGAKSQVYSLITAVLVVFTLLFLMPLFKNLPQTTLAAIVIASMLALIDFGYLRRLYTISQYEFFEATAALIGVLVMGVLPGIGLGVGLAAVALTYRSSYPGSAVLGKLPGQDVYRDITRHPDAQTIPSLLIFRFDASPFFANAPQLERKLKAALREARPPAKAVIIDCESMNMIDSTAMERLAALHAELASRQVGLGFARVRDPVLDAMRRDGLVELFGSENFFPSIGDAVAEFSSRLEES